MNINKKIFLPISLTCIIAIQSSELKFGEKQNIKIFNNTDNVVKAIHNILEYAEADIVMKRLEEPQIMLHNAIINNSTQEILQAINLGANVNLPINNKLPILIAKILKKNNAYEVLIKAGAIVPSFVNMMYEAILNDAVDDIKKIFEAAGEHKIFENIKEGKSALAWAVIFAKHNAVEALLNCGFQANQRCQTDDKRHEGHVDLIDIALLNHDFKTAILLLKSGASFPKGITRYGGRTELMDYLFGLLHNFTSEIIVNQLLEIIQLLIDQGYDINTTGSCVEYRGAILPLKSPWQLAMNTNSLNLGKIIELLMKNGATPNQIISDGASGNPISSPLAIAVMSKNIKAVELLLAAGANKNQTISYIEHGARSAKGTPVLLAEFIKNNPRIYGSSEDILKIIEILRKHN